MRYALITGGVGFIASYLSRQLIDGGHVDRIVAIDHYGRYADSTRPNFIDFRRKRIEDFVDKLIIERGEAKYYSVMNTIIEKYRPLYIYHLAALPLAKIDNINTQEGIEGSVESTSNILEIIGQMKELNGYCPKRFIYTSSSMVYGDFISDVANEDHPTNPKELYGTMKLAGEIITRGLGNFYDIPTVIIRPTAVYGPTDMNRRVSQIFIEKAMAGQKLTIQGKEEALDFTYVKDVAAGFVLCAIHDNAVNQTFNIAHGKAHRLLDYVLCLKKHFPDLEYDIAEREAFRPKRGTLSIDKAKSLLGFGPAYSLEQGIAEYVDFMKAFHRRRVGDFDGKQYTDLKDFERLYRERGAYHSTAHGYKKWFLMDNYRSIAAECKNAHKVLDLACGEGVLGSHLSCDYLAGVDNSATALELNRKHHPRLYGDLYQADMRNLADISFEHTRRFDHIVCSLSLMYILKDDLEHVLKQIYELLEHGGCFVFTYPLFHEGRNASPEADELHPTELSERLSATGFEIEAMYPFCPMVPSWVYEKSADSKEEENAFKEYETLKNRMTMENAYHFLCNASKRDDGA